MVLGLQGLIRSVLIEEVFAAEKRQIALDVLDEAEREQPPRARRRAAGGNQERSG